MSRTVSARIKPEVHNELRERCNKVGCNINDFIEASIEFALKGNTQFDFGDEQLENKNENLISNQNSTDSHLDKIPVIHLQWKDGKLVQGKTTWRSKPIIT